MIRLRRTPENLLRWICPEKSCRAVHHYPVDVCQRCGKTKPKPMKSAQIEIILKRIGNHG